MELFVSSQHASGGVGLGGGLGVEGWDNVSSATEERIGQQKCLCMIPSINPCNCCTGYKSLHIVSFASFPLCDKVYEVVAVWHQQLC